MGEDVLKIDVGESLLDDFHQRFFDIPFGQSVFQNTKFVVETQRTPGRMYRAIGLNLKERIERLQTASFSLRRKEIDIAEAQHKIEDAESLCLTIFDIQRLELDIEEYEASKKMTAKLVNDSLIEAMTLYNLMKQFPEYTREMFESEEKEYYRESLQRQLNQVTGARDALEVLNFDDDRLQKIIDDVSQKLIGEKDGDNS